MPFLPDFGGLQFFPAAAIALIICGLFGWANDSWLWKPLRRRGTGLIAAMIVSIGLGIFLRYFYLYLFTGNTQQYPDYQGAKGIEIGPINLAAGRLLVDGRGAARADGAPSSPCSRPGSARRPARCRTTRRWPPPPASTSTRVIRVVWIAGAALAGLAGVLLGLAQGINFQMGFQILLLIFAAVTLGGLGTAFGALVGSLVVGLFISVSTLWIPVELKNVGALGILIVILLVRPQGILGRAQRVG